MKKAFSLSLLLREFLEINLAKGMSKALSLDNLTSRLVAIVRSLSGRLDRSATAKVFPIVLQFFEIVLHRLTLPDR